MPDTDRLTHEIGHIRRQLTVPVAFVVLALCTASVLLALWVKRDQMFKHAEDTQTHFTRAQQRILHDRADGFKTIAELLMRDSAIQQAWLSGDRDELRRVVSPIFSGLEANHSVTHFYFHDTAGRNVLRVHQPSRFGDIIPRYTLRQAMETGNETSGLELGTFGRFVLRTVVPWHINGRAMGYLELGTEIENINAMLAAQLETDAIVLVEKALINRGDWESYISSRGQTPDWNLLPTQVVADTTLSSVPGALVAMIKDSGAATFERAIRLTENRRDYYGRASPLRDVAGNTVGQIIVLQDTTEIKKRILSVVTLVTAICVMLGLTSIASYYAYAGRISRQLQNAYQNLEREADERRRTAEQLQEHRDRLLEANKELESFTYSIAHDLRSPLRSIVSFSQVLAAEAEPKLTTEEQNDLQRIVRAGKKMAGLIDDILRLAGVARGTKETAVVDVSALAREIVEELQQADPVRQARWSIEGNMSTRGDPTMIRLLISNLLGNAWKYSRDTRPAEIAFHQVTRDGHSAYAVEDNGCGFDMQYADKLFKPFHRLHRPDEFEGTGVGLAIAERVVKRHGGRIWAESAPGSGAKFYFTLGAT